MGWPVQLIWRTLKGILPTPYRGSFILQTSKYGNAASEHAGQGTQSCHFIYILLCFLTELLPVVRFGAGRVLSVECLPHRHENLISDPQHSDSNLRKCLRK